MYKQVIIIENNNSYDHQDSINDLLSKGWELIKTTTLYLSGNQQKYSILYSSVLGIK